MTAAYRGSCPILVTVSATTRTLLCNCEYLTSAWRASCAPIPQRRNWLRRVA
jgi:hypothetical protein